MSGLYTKVNGQFVLAQANIKYNNQWRDAYQIYTKENNNWREVYQYRYDISDWSACSVSCGGGVQTRTATCTRSDNITKDDGYCRKYGLQKPSLSQTCNTQSCMDSIRFTAHTDCGISVVPIQVAYTGQSYHPLTINPNSHYTYCATGHSRCTGQNFAVSDFYNQGTPPPWGFLLDFNSVCGGGNYAGAYLTSGNATIWTLTSLDQNQKVAPLDSGRWVNQAPSCWGGPGCSILCRIRQKMEGCGEWNGGAKNPGCGFYSGSSHGHECSSMIFAIVPN